MYSACCGRAAGCCWCWCITPHVKPHVEHVQLLICGMPGWRTGTYANLVKQAKSKQKILDKMYEAGLTPPVTKESTFAFTFPGQDCQDMHHVHVVSSCSEPGVHCCSTADALMIHIQLAF